MFRQSWLVRVSQGPTQGPGSPGAGGGGVASRLQAWQQLLGVIRSNGAAGA